MANKIMNIIMDDIKSTKRMVTKARGANIILNKLKSHVDIPGWNIESSKTAVYIERERNLKPEGETPMDFFLNMIDVVNKVLDTKMDIETSQPSYGEGISLQAHKIINVPVTVQQRLSGKKIYGKKLFPKTELPSIYVFVKYGKSTECETEVVETIPTYYSNHKTVQLTGKCKQAVEAMMR